MKHPGSTPDVLKASCHNHAPLLQLLESLPHWSVAQRKALLTLCRCQILPTPNSTAYLRLRDVLKSPIYFSQTRRAIPIIEFILQLDILKSPILSGLVSMAARSMPYNRIESVLQELDEGIDKELLAAVEVYHPTNLNWTPIFSHRASDRAIPLHDTYPSRPELASEIYDAFTRAKRRLQSHPLFPDYSKKTVGREATRNMARMVSKLQLDDVDDIWSLYGVERIYHETGVRVCGRTEVRWAWKFNDLKPRVYYARGPDQHRSSCFIQAIFNTFVDEFPNTNRFERFFTTSIVGKPGETCFIYDYSAFTSSLEEVKHFIRDLAVFCHGTMITVIDTFHGPIQRDLGEILLDYVNECNDFVPFDASRISGLPDEEIFPLHTCGMLGVPGNISSCTLLHGIHLAWILGSLTNNKAVGDDAIGWISLETPKAKEELVSSLQNIGRMAKSKMMFWPPDWVGEEIEQDKTWHYLKRPATRVANRLVSSVQAIWPSPNVLLSIRDDYHTLFPPKDILLQVKKCCNMLLSFTLQFRFMEILDTEVEYIDRFVRYSVMSMRERISSPWVWEGKVYPHGFRSRDVMGDLLEDHWNCRVVLPVEYDPSLETSFDVTREIKGRMNGAWKLAVDLGYAVSDLETEAFVVRDRPDYFERWLNKEIVGLYRFAIIRSPPVWLKDLLSRGMSLLPSVSMDPLEVEID